MRRCGPPKAAGRIPTRLQRLWCALPLLPFLSAGHRSCIQVRMASSFRWLARRTGFWRLHPQARRMRPTWEGWYETPKVRRMTSAIRPSVHTAPRKPYASGPCSSRPGSPPRCSWLSLGSRPGALRRLSPSGPSSLARLSHWLTAPLVIPNAIAMSFCFHPNSLSSQARNRRPSRQSTAWLDNIFMNHILNLV